MALKTPVKEQLQGVECIVEESPVRVSSSSGLVETKIGVYQGHLRTAISNFEQRYQMEFEGTHHAVPWLIPHVAASLNRFIVGKDGCTVYKRWKGKKGVARRPIARKHIFSEDLVR